MKCTLYNWKSESLINLNLTADSIHFCILRIIFLSFVHLEILYIWMAWYYFHSTENPTYSSKSRSRFIFWKAPLWRWVHANVFFFFFLNDLGNFLSPPFSFFYFLKIIWFIFYCAGFSLLGGLFSCHSKQSLLSHFGAWVFHCSGFSWCRVQALGCLRFSSCSSWALEHRLNSCGPRA